MKKLKRSVQTLTLTWFEEFIHYFWRTWASVGSSQEKVPLGYRDQGLRSGVGWWGQLAALQTCCRIYTGWVNNSSAGDTKDSPRAKETGPASSSHLPLDERRAMTWTDSRLTAHIPATRWSAPQTLQNRLHPLVRNTEAAKACTWLNANCVFFKKDTTIMLGTVSPYDLPTQNYHSLIKKKRDIWLRLGLKSQPLCSTVSLGN